MCIRDRSVIVLLLELKINKIAFATHKQRGKAQSCSIPVSYTHLDVYKRQMRINV